MLELQIISPKPEQKFPQIRWNYEELKAEIAKAMQDYQNLVVTEDSEKDCKETRAKLNKLRTAIETARKDMKKKINEPLKIFEEQVKEVEEPIDTAIRNLDGQLQELVESRKEQKRKDIEVIWNGMAKKPSYLTIDRIWNEKWLNATYSMKQVTEDMNGILRENEQNIEAINRLPEFSFEAMHYYTKTLDLKAAIATASEHAEMERRKKEAEAKKAAEAEKKEQEAKVVPDAKNMPETPQNEVIKKTEPEKTEDKLYTFRFEVTLTAGQAKALGEFCRAHGITLSQIK